MRKPRGQGHSDIDGIAGNTDQFEIQSTGKLMRGNWGPIAAALITATASLMIYVFQQVRHIDERLDVLEREAAALVGGDGNIRPSNDAMRNTYQLEHIKERLERLEQQ